MSEYKLPENWESMPVVNAMIGSNQKKIKYDKETGLVYLLDDNGNWTGEKATAPPAMKASLLKNTTELEEAADNPKDIQKRKQRPQKSKLTPLLIIIIVVLAAIIFIQNSSGGGSKSYTVIIAMQNIQPGEKINDKLATLSISAEEYMQYSSAGGVYLEGDFESIEDYVATSFIPQDGVITYTNVGTTYIATNPWNLKDKPYTITIPVEATTDNLEQFIWGTTTDITFNAKKVIDENAYPEADYPITSDADSNSTLQSIHIITYLMKNVTIVDVLNNQKESLFSSYAAMASVPELYQKESLNARYTNGKQVQSDTPAYIQIEVTKETKEWWDLLTRRYTVKVALEVTGKNCGNSLQTDIYNSIKTMLPAMKSAWSAALED